MESVPRQIMTSPAPLRRNNHEPQFALSSVWPNLGHYRSTHVGGRRSRYLV